MITPKLIAFLLTMLLPAPPRPLSLPRWSQPPCHSHAPHQFTIGNMLLPNLCPIAKKYFLEYEYQSGFGDGSQMGEISISLSISVESKCTKNGASPPLVLQQSFETNLMHKLFAKVSEWNKQYFLESFFFFFAKGNGGKNAIGYELSPL